jgi:Ca-activated chloride channel family protein
MSEYIENKTKVNQVKDMMRYIIPQISPSTKIGLRVYGHTCNIIAYNACRSSELVVPLNINNNHNVLSELNKLRPRGMTPITYSLKQAVKKDFEGFNGIKHIILLTDGGENCDESPCEYAINLVKKRHP